MSSWYDCNLKLTERKINEVEMIDRNNSTDHEKKVKCEILFITTGTFYGLGSVENLRASVKLLEIKNVNWIVRHWLQKKF